MSQTGWTSQQVAEVEEARVAVRAADLEYEAAKADAKRAKEYLERKKIELTSLLDGFISGQQSLPFGDGSAPNPENQAVDLTGVDDERWRKISLGSLGLKPKHLEALNNADLFTVGQLADWTKNGGELQTLDGIGPKAEEQIADALTAFWATFKAEYDAEQAQLDQESPPISFTPLKDYDSNDDQDDD